MLKKIIAFFVLRKQINKIKEVLMKSGIKTSEFWVTVITCALNVWGAIQGLIPHNWAIWVITIAGAIYTISRGIAKITPTKIDDEVLAKIKELLKK